MAESTPSRSLPLRWLAEARDALASILIPEPCRLCGALLNHSLRIPVCQACLDGFSRIPEKICVVCGLPLPDMAVVPGETLRCSACRLETYSFDCARSFALYEDQVVRAIVLLKFERIEPLAKWFAQRLAEIYARNVESLTADVVVPVPLHRDRERSADTTRPNCFQNHLPNFSDCLNQGVLLVRKRPSQQSLC